jgi:stage V sporulation protein B
VLSLTTIIDTLMVQNRLLSTGMNEISVRVYYGDYTSLVISMFNLPTIFFYPIANALVPLISATREEGDEGKSEKIRTLSLRVITLISMPCAIGLGIFSYPILDLLMFKQSSVERAAPWLSVASVSVLFLGIIAATNTFLNASGKQKLPIISMIVGATAKLVSNYFLLGKVGMYGAPISTVICYICAATLNVYFVLKYVGRLPSIIKIVGLPFLISILSIGSAVGIFILTGRIIPQKIATIVSIVLAIVLYVVLLFVFKGITKEDLHAIPGGNKAIKILQKLKIPIK